MELIAIRGAISLNSNTKEEITAKTVQLIGEIVEANKLRDNGINIVSCILSSTSDITEYYPASAITESLLLPNVALFSTQEPNIKNSLPLCIRVLLTVSCSASFEVRHIYLGDTAKLKTNTNKT